MDKRWTEFVFIPVMVAQLLFLLSGCQGGAPPAQLIILNKYVVLQNGLVNVTLSNPGGLVTGISYAGIDNLLETNNNFEDNRGYWDIVWGDTGTNTANFFDKLQCTRFGIIMQNENQIEVSFTRTWSSSSVGVPLNIDKRYVILRGSSGFYTYAIFEHFKGFPAVKIPEARVAFKLSGNKFHYMAMSDERQRIMPTIEDRETGQVLDYPEAVLLTHPSNPDIKNEVDDKYFYSCENKDNKVHGWVSTDDPPVGFWIITPSNEFRTGGPHKQDLTSHVGPTSLCMFISTHYAGDDLDVKIMNGEPWKKVFGPCFVYLNSNPMAKTNPSLLWKDAKAKMSMEVASWPYSFPLSKDYSQANQRGLVRGQLLVYDRYLKDLPIPSSNAYVGLAASNSVGSWQRENKDYQFWTQADNQGRFSIPNVIAGSYNLHAWVPGYIGDYMYESRINIAPGSEIQLNGLVYKPPRFGPTLWEIGIPDRTASEFFIPGPSQLFKAYNTQIQVDKFREYGLWARYSDVYPKIDLVFTVGVSDFKRDWFYAQVVRIVGNHMYQPTTWQIVFDVKVVDKAKNYTLRLALASANAAELQVRVNNPKMQPPLFTTGLIGKDNAIARHGIHGLYWLYNIGIPGRQFINGRNIIFLTQARCAQAFQGIMYDYIRLEGPDQIQSSSTN